MTARSALRLTAPSLLAHVFLIRGRPGDADGWECFRFWWQHVVGHLGLDQAIPRLGVPRSLPPRGEVTGAAPALVAAAERNADSIWQAAAWTAHDACCLSVMIAPPRSLDCADAWHELDQAWAQVAPGPPTEGLLGETRTFLALLDDRPAACQPPRVAPVICSGTRRRRRRTAPGGSAGMRSRSALRMRC